MKFHTIKTLSSLRESFWAAHPQFAAERRSRKPQNDYRTDIRVAWCDYVDSLSRSGDISSTLSASATL